MILLHQTSERTIQSLVRPHWLNTLTATVNGFTGGALIGYFVTAVTTARGEARAKPLLETLVR
jgi:hypothetical protein